MLIEPTESVGHQELDQFIEAMKSIAREAVEDPELVLMPPHTHRRSTKQRARNRTALETRSRRCS